MGHDSNVKTYAAIERDLHYAGAILVAVQAAIFIMVGHRSMEWTNVIAFIVVLFVWMFIAARWVCLRSGDHVLKCRVMVFLPDYYVRRICNRQSTLTIK